MHGIWRCISWLHYFLIAKTWNCNVWEEKGANMTFTTANMNLINSTTRNIILTLCILQWVRLLEASRTLQGNHMHHRVLWEQHDNANTSLARSFCKYPDTKGTFFYKNKTKQKKHSRQGRGTSVLSSEPPEPPQLQREFAHWGENRFRWEARPPRARACFPRNAAPGGIFILSTPSKCASLSCGLRVCVQKWFYISAILYLKLLLRKCQKSTHSFHLEAGRLTKSPQLMTLRFISDPHRNANFR